MEESGYRVPAKSAAATIVEKKSEFIGAIAPAETEAQALAFLEGVRAGHRTASHNVYAYVLRENARQRYSDDGEPAKTAGLPVLSCIQHAGLNNCIIVVTRYFGGTLLGTGGLVRAYTAAANAAIAAAGSAEIRLVRTLALALPYGLYEQARRLWEAAGARPENEPVFAEDVQLSVTLPAAEAPPLAQALQELLRGGPGLAVGEPHYKSW